MKRFSSKQRWYWFCQVAGWFVGFGVSQFLAFVVLGKFRAGVDNLPLYLAVKALAALLLSHAYRGLVLRFGVLDAPVGRQTAVGALGVLGVALGMVGLEWVESGLREGNWQPFTGLTFAFDVMASARYSAIWVLAYHFFGAGQRLARLEVRELQAAAARRQAELDLLRSQINPHFLFNALNSVRALALSDPHRARTAVTQLAELLRYTLNYEQRQLIPLGEELAAVRDYLALEQTRFGPERLRFEVQAPPEALGAPVPPTALLTLVENAVKHGIAASPAGGLVAVHAAQNGPGLTLTVSQPGRLPAADRPAAPGSGLGLANTRQRLLALYGERASLALEENPPGTVTAFLRLPGAAPAALPASSPPAHEPHPAPAAPAPHVVG